MKKIDKEKLETAKTIASKSLNKTAYESLEESILKVFRWLSSLIDRLFLNNVLAAVFALILACLSYFVVTYDDSSSTLSSSKVLSNVSLNARYNAETFELSGIPTGCEIILTGDAASVNNASSKKGYCQVDLEGYTEGTHSVKVRAVGYGDNVNSTVTPSEVIVTLKKKTTMPFDLSYDFINKNSMDSRYILSEPQFEITGKINIRASQDTLNSIALVKALIDVAGQTNSFEIDAPLVAYDKNGQAVNAEIVPSFVKASVNVSSPSNEVPIKLNPTGSAPSGLAIDTVNIVDHQTTRIYAPENVLNTVSEVYVNFDMSTIAESVDKEIMLPVTLPSGVNASDVTVVNVKITLTTVDSLLIEGVPLNVRDNFNNLAVSSADITSLDVTISGSINNINNVDKSDIDVYFIMPEAPGIYNLPLYVTVNNNPYVSAALSKGSVNVTIVEANQ